MKRGNLSKHDIVLDALVRKLTRRGGLILKEFEYPSKYSCQGEIDVARIREPTWWEIYEVKASRTDNNYRHALKQLRAAKAYLCLKVGLGQVDCYYVVPERNNRLKIERVLNGRRQE